MKAALIIDKSKAYRHFERDRFLKKWGVELESTTIAETLTDVSGSDLFGENHTVIIEVEDDQALKKIVEETSKISSEDFINKFDSKGIILQISSPRTKTKKIEAFFQKVGSNIIIPPSGRELSITEKLLSTLGVREEVKEYLKNYAGEDYENIIPIVDSLLDFTPQQQKKVTLEDIYIRLPQPAGAIPAWEIENPIFDGDIEETIKTSRRIISHTGYMLLLTILKNKLLSYYKVSKIIEANPKIKDDEIIRILDLNPKGFYFTRKKVNSYSPEKFTKALELLVELESDLKGASSAPKDSRIELFLIRLVENFKRSSR